MIKTKTTKTPLMKAVAFGPTSCSSVLVPKSKPYHQELVKLGLRPNAKVLPPRIVAFIAEKFCIDIK